MKNNNTEKLIDIIKNNKALTLIEIIVTMAILGIIIAFVFSFQSFETKIFNRTVTKSDLQSDVRTAADYIVSELRNATEISLSTPANPSNYSRIYISSNQIAVNKTDGSNAFRTEAVIAESDDLSFLVAPSGASYMLSFSIKATKDGQDYQTTGSVVLNNIREITGSTSGNSIYYIKDLTITDLPEPTTSEPITGGGTTEPPTGATTAEATTEAPPSEPEVSGISGISKKSFALTFSKQIANATISEGGAVSSFPSFDIIFENSGNYSNNTPITINVTATDGTTSTVVVIRKGVNWSIYD